MIGGLCRLAMPRLEGKASVEARLSQLAVTPGGHLLLAGKGRHHGAPRLSLGQCDWCKAPQGTTHPVSLLACAQVPASRGCNNRAST